MSTARIQGHWTQKELKERGWNVRLIDELLGEPDAEKRTLYGFMYLYRQDRVLKREESEEFKTHMAKRQARAGAARKMLDTKKRKTVQLVEGLNLSVPQMPLEELGRRAVSNYNAHHTREWDFEESKSTSVEALRPWGEPDEFRDRICVNYLRHRRTHYDSALSALTSRVGRREAQRLLWRRIADEIGRAYPALKDEAERQYRRRFEEAEAYV